MIDGRSYTLLTIKAFDEEARTFTGIATTPTPDCDGDIIDPLGVTFKNPLPLLLHHDKTRPVGQVWFDPPTAAGITFRAQIPKVDEPGVVKDRVDEAWHSVKARLLAGVSVRVVSTRDKVKQLAHGAIHWLKSTITELSLVTIPANAEATILTIKSSPVVSGSLPVVYLTTTKDRTMKTIIEQVKGLEASRKAKTDRLEEIQNTVTEAGRTKDEKEREEFDALKGDITSIDAELADLRAMDEINKAGAVAVKGKTTEEGVKSRQHIPVVSVKDNDLPGFKLARLAICKAAGVVLQTSPLEIARERFPNEPWIQSALKAAVAGAIPTTAAWAGDLIQLQDYTQDFVNYLRPQTILGKFGTDGIPDVSHVPFNIRIGTETSGGAAAWVGAGLPKPLTKFDYATITMAYFKIANIAVITDEIARFSTLGGGAEKLVRDALAKAIIAQLDQDFVNPANAGTANVKPASITNGVAAIPSNGNQVDEVNQDIKDVIAPFITANNDLSDGVWIMSSTLALSLSLMRSSLGVRDYPDISMKGGTFMGLPVIVSQYVNALGSPSTGMVILVKASDILLADDGQVTVDASREASLQMDDAPSNSAATGTGQVSVSMFQTNSIALRAERYINWRKRRTTSVQYLSPVTWGAES
jgi:HK97 family phage major capsid protein